MDLIFHEYILNKTFYVQEQFPVIGGHIEINIKIWVWRPKTCFGIQP